MDIVRSFPCKLFLVLSNTTARTVICFLLFYGGKLLPGRLLTVRISPDFEQYFPCADLSCAISFRRVCPNCVGVALDRLSMKGTGPGPARRSVSRSFRFHASAFRGRIARSAAARLGALAAAMVEKRPHFSRNRPSVGNAGPAAPNRPKSHTAWPDSQPSF